jgi:hypothetical protein
MYKFIDVMVARHTPGVTGRSFLVLYNQSVREFEAVKGSPLGCVDTLERSIGGGFRVVGWYDTEDRKEWGTDRLRVHTDMVGWLKSPSYEDAK